MSAEIIVAFSYASIPPGLASELKTAAETIRRLGRQVSTDIICIGNHLVAAKEKLDHGHFGPWLRAEFSMTERTARNYMQVSEAFSGKSETVSVLQPTALYLLASPSTPQRVKESIVTRVARGEVVSLETIRNAVADAKFEAKQTKITAEFEAKEARLTPRAKKSRAQREEERRKQDEQRRLDRQRHERAIADFGLLLRAGLSDVDLARAVELLREMEYIQQHDLIAALLPSTDGGDA
jgi:hypothetical protein